MTLDQAGTETVSVDYATADGTAAAAGSDYAATAGTLTIAAGSVAATITVPILDDTLVEPIEAFTVTLSDAAVRPSPTPKPPPPSPTTTCRL